MNEIVVADNVPKQAEAYGKQRKSILDFVGSQLKENTDYGHPFPGSGKKSLLKPGAEKFCGLLQLEPVFVADTDTWQMMGGKDGMLVLICFLMSGDRKTEALHQLKELGMEFKLDIYRNLAAAEGRGAGNLEEKKTMNENNLVKIVEKRALVDAVLRLAGLSELFTQDGEDEAQKESKHCLTCPECGKKTIIGPGKKAKIKNFYCYPKLGGCGKKFAMDEPRITIQFENPNNHDELPGPEAVGDKDNDSLPF